MPRPYLGHPAAQLVDADDAALNQCLTDGVDPALVVGHLLVRISAQAFDVASQLIYGHQSPIFAREEHQQRVYPLLPQSVIVLGARHGTGRLPAHVVRATRVLVSRSFGITHDPIIDSAPPTHLDAGAAAPAAADLPPAGAGDAGGGGACGWPGGAAGETFAPSATVFGRFSATRTFSSKPLSTRMTLPSVPATLMGVNLTRLSGPMTATIRLPSRMISAGAGTST